MAPTTEPHSSPNPDASTAPRERLFSGGLAIPVVLTLAALAVRIAFVFILPRQLQWVDAREFDEIARGLAEHGTYGLRTLRAPGYPTFVAGIYCLFGPNLLALRLVEAALSALSVVLIGALGVRLFGRRAGLLAMTLAAFHPMLAFMPATGFSESLSILVMALTLIAAFSALERSGARRWALVGLLLGLQSLIRPNAIMLLPGLGLGFALLLHRRGRGWVLPVFVTGIAFALTLAPWMIRSHQVHHRWFFISTGGGRQLWLGNNINATCITTQDPIVDDATRAGMKAAGDIFHIDAYLYSEAMKFIREHPGRAAQLYLVKLGNIFALYPETFSRNYVNNASRLSQGVASVVLFAGALLGLTRLRKHPPLWPILLGSLSFVLATALAFSSLRYRMLFEPCLILLAGVGWASVWPKRERTS